MLNMITELVACCLPNYENGGILFGLRGPVRYYIGKMKFYDSAPSERYHLMLDSGDTLKFDEWRDVERWVKLNANKIAVF